MTTYMKPQRALEVFRSDENPKHLYIHSYAPLNENLKNITDLFYNVAQEEKKLIKTIEKIALPEEGKIIRSEWGKTKTDDNVGILVIRFTANKNFITNQKIVALKLNSLVWHPTNSWLTDVCKTTNILGEGEILTRNYE